MSEKGPVLRIESASKWINTFLVVCGGLLGLVTYRFLVLLNGKFGLEAIIPKFNFISQILSFLVPFLVFILIKKHRPYYLFLEEVYTELTKVIWPSNESTWKTTGFIIVALAISGFILIMIDLGAQKLLSLIY